MSTKTYKSVTGAIFGLIAILHLGRIIFSWNAMIGGWAVPASWVAMAVASYLAVQAWKLSRQSY